MAESMPLDKSMTRGSDSLPDIYCDSCYDVEGKILQAKRFCKNCSENLCQDCTTAHKKQKISRNHELVDKKGSPQKRQSNKGTISATVKCSLHEGEVLRSYCRSCDQLCCKICQTIDHHTCNMQSLTNAAANIKDSQQLKDIKKKMKVLKEQYNENLSKAKKQTFNIKKFYTDAIKEMRNLQTKFEDEDSKNMESISKTCNIIAEQINKISSNVDQMQDNSDNDTVFISIKRAENQLKSFEERLFKLETDNTIQQYTFEPETKLKAMLDELKMLGKLSFHNSTSLAPISQEKTGSASMLKTPVFIKHIELKSSDPRGSVLLPNQRLLHTDYSNAVKLIDIKNSTIVSELHLPNAYCYATQVKYDQVAITCKCEQKIHFVSVSSDKLSKGKKMSVGGVCRGIAYNDQDDTLIVTYDSPPKVEIMSLTGTVIKRFDKDANGALLFSQPWYVALSHVKTMIYVTDTDLDTVTLMTLTGEVKAVYKDKTLQRPRGVCVNRFGIVYVVGNRSYTVHQIMPGSDKLEPLLDKTHGLIYPCTVTYCDVEDKLYVGQENGKGLNIFNMR